MNGRRRCLGFLLASAVALVSVLVGSASSAGAEESVRAGWWTTAPPAAIAPDAPDDALVVQGGADEAEPLAYAAVAYTVPADETPVSLTLVVADGSASIPTTTLTACPLTEPLIPAQGGPMADAPGFDCATSTTAEPADDGASYTFDLSGFEPAPEVALAILPGTQTSRVVLEPPHPTGLETAARSVDPTASGPAAEGPATEVAPDDGSTPEPPTAPAERPVPAITAPAPDEPGPAPAAPTEEPASTGERPTEAERAAPPALAEPVSDRGDSPFPALLFGVMAAGAITLWLFAGRSSEHARLPFAEATVTSVGEGEGS